MTGGQSKLYFTDPLIARLPSLRDRAIAPPDVTYLSEQQLGVCLLRVIARTDHLIILDEGAVLVQRNPNTGSEIDFVGALLETPIESKYVSHKWKQERKALDQRSMANSMFALISGDANGRRHVRTGPGCRAQTIARGG